MNRDSPLLQAVRSQDDSMMNTDVNTSDISTVMTYDQMTYLLTMMITITVISVIILIVSVSAILAFLWYTKNLLTRKCTGCHNLPSSANINNIPVYQQQQLVSQPHFVSVSGHQLKNISPPSSHLNNMSLQQKNIYLRPSKNVTVNPLPPPSITLNNQNQFKCSSKLMSTIKQSEESQASRSCADNSISNPDYEINQTSLDEVERGPSEPIYAEIKGKETNQEEKSNSETSSAKPGEHQENGKKEIEYWQITAKEVVKFRPCTETFIVRE